MSPKLKAVIIMGLVLGSVLSMVLLQFTSTESKLGILDDYNKLGDSFTQSSVSSVMQTINNPSVETTTQYVEQQEDQTEVTPTPTPEPENEDEVLLPMQLIMQISPDEFAGSDYGTSRSLTIRSSGCYLCSLFMCGSTINATGDTPMNYSLSTVAAYAIDSTYMSGNAVRGTNVASSLSYSLEHGTTSTYNKITDSEAFYNVVKEEVDAGRPLMFRISGSWPNWHPRNSQHSTAIRGYGENEQGKYVVFHDPAKGLLRIPLADINCSNVSSGAGWVGYSKVG